MLFWTDRPETWRGKNLKVAVLYASAGIAQQILVQSPEGMVLADAGDGTLRDLLSHDVHPNTISGIVITHGHFDHMGGLHSLLGFMRMCGRTQPLSIFAPAGCSEVGLMLGSFLRIYRESTPFEMQIRDLPPYRESSIADITVKAYPMIHCGSTEAGGILDPIPALGYRLTCGDETVAVSGDSGDCPALREMVSGVDLAVIEATFPHSTSVSPETLQKVHLSEDLANEIGRLAHEHILVHKATIG